MHTLLSCSLRCHERSRLSEKKSKHAIQQDIPFIERIFVNNDENDEFGSYSVPNKDNMGGT
jgi:hypothetical protein